jgi:uncharacterized membrane protein
MGALITTIVRFFLTGVATLLPFLVTAFLFVWVLSMADAYIGPSSTIGRFLVTVFGPERKYPGYVIGYTLMAVLVTLIGFLVTQATVGRFRKAVDSTLARIPLFGKIYAGVGQVVDLLGKRSQSGASGFGGCVQVEVGGVKVLALLATAEKYVLEDGKEHLLVFVPNSPFPATGFNMLVPVEQVQVLDMPSEDLLKILMSLGLLGPQLLKKPAKSFEMEQKNDERVP